MPGPSLICSRSFAPGGSTHERCSPRIGSKRIGGANGLTGHTMTPVDYEIDEGSESDADGSMNEAGAGRSTGHSWRQSRQRQTMSMMPGRGCEASIGNVQQAVLHFGQAGRSTIAEVQQMSATIVGTVNNVRQFTDGQVKISTF